jgi:autotransporter passenger strand-loop-strand repeat protein
MSGSSNAPVLTTFTPGDLVVSVVGDGDGSGSYGDNQATPIVLEELTTSGQEVGQETLPQQTTIVAGTTEYAISGEYGSSSEGSLELSADGKSLVIAGYGVNDTTYNNGEENGQDVYGNAALAQSTSLTNQTTYTPVARVIADISYTGAVDTSTALYNVFNTNNPRSVATIDGKSFYIAGQGVKGDTTQGVFVAQDGASSATAIDTSSDTRTVEIYDGKLYVSRDSKTATPAGGSISQYGASLPTGAAAPNTLPGLAVAITLTATQENSVNGAFIGQSVELSPENYFFANPTTLYVADGGQPKEGGVGDGGLQKWTLNPTTGVWTLQYTLSAGLNLVENSSVSSNTHGTTGLIGLTGVVNANGTVTLYTTNSTIADLDQTYVYSITDTVSATTPAANESFAVIDTAAPDTNVRGIAFAPSAPVNTTIGSGQTTPSGLIISTGGTLTVSAGGAAVAVVVNSGGTATISGTDTNSLIQADGMETVTGSATGDQVWGTQLVSGAGAAARNETVEYGGVVDVYGGATATGITVETSGGVYISGGGVVNNAVVNGGSIVLQSAQDVLGGSLVFSGGGTVTEVSATAAGDGVTAVISGFTAGDLIDLPFASGALTSSVVSGNTVEKVTSGAVSESFTFAGQYALNPFALVSSGGVAMLTISATSVTSGATVTVSSGYSQPDITVGSSGTLKVSAGGALLGATILSKGSATVAGTDFGTTISSGGKETISGPGSVATGDQIYGTQTVQSGGLAVNETVYSGGSLNLAGNGTADLVISGGTVTISTSTDTIAGGVTFAGGGQINLLAAPATSANGLTAVISGFGAGDSINAPFVGANATLTSVTSGGNTIVTISGSTGSESVTFAGTYFPGYFQISGGSQITPPIITISAGSSTTPNFVVSSGVFLNVLAGGAAAGVTILSGGSASIAGTDTGTTISAGGNELILGTATGDQIYGTQVVSAGTAVVNNETVFNGGMLDLYLKGAVANNTVINAGGSLNISGNATANNTVIQGGTIGMQSSKSVLTGGVTFAGAGSIILTALTSAATTTGTYGDQAVISGFGAGDFIDVTSIGTGATLSQTTSGGNTVETITSGGTSETFIFAGVVPSSSFALVSDGGTGVEIEAACFCAGTNIRTPDGEALVETLKIGDLVMTAGGQAVPVRWVGVNTVSTRFADPLRVMPVRIRAGALAENLPERDLLLSPDHAMFLGGVLLQAGALVNGSSITREVQMPQTFTYYHVEVANHELILAEGAPTETFVDYIGRMSFDNWAEHEALYGNEPDIAEMPYPRVRSARQMPMALRRLLAARAEAICGTALAG